MARKRIEISALPRIFTMFGECPWTELGEAVASLSLHGTYKTIRERMRNEVPAGPGVYGMVDAEGHTIYVGMSKELPNRLRSYFSAKSADKRQRRIRRRAVHVVWQSFPHELIARLRERELIHRFRPPLNVQGHPVQMKVGYIVATQQAAESFQLVTEIPRQHAGIWGPIPYHKFSRKAVEELNLHFGLRDCPKQTTMHFDVGNSNGTLTVPLTCLRADLQSCLSPCIAACTEREYASAFRSAQKFLSGNTHGVIKDISQQMTDAAKNQQFEQAAKLRDRVKHFEYINNHLRRFHDWSSQATHIYEVPSRVDDSPVWLLIVRGVVIEAIAKPDSPEATQQAVQRFEEAQDQFSGDSASRSVYRRGDFEAARILFRWFRKHPDEEDNLLSTSSILQASGDRKRCAS